MSLAERLAARIAAEGPIRLADWMEACLQHPVFGYYVTRDPLGAGGDFTTAPEISQMFGELVGLALARAWIDQGAPGRVALVELGPGRGTLMADAWRATARVPGFHAAAAVWLVETSPALRARQMAAVPWATCAARLEEVPDLPLFLIANEFFDALPVRQFHATPEGWREAMVGWDGTRFHPALSPPLAAPDGPPGRVREVCPAGEAIAATIGARLRRRGGAALIVDYGDWTGAGDTVQAIAGHAPTDPFANPGAADLTAHVGFGALAHAAATPHAFATQGAWLAAMGIGARAAALAQAGPVEAEAVAAELTRLTDPAQMGRLFKVLALHPPGAACPPGFDAPTHMPAEKAPPE